VGKKMDEKRTSSSTVNPNTDFQAADETKQRVAIQYLRDQYELVCRAFDKLEIDSKVSIPTFAVFSDMTLKFMNILGFETSIEPLNQSKHSVKDVNHVLLNVKIPEQHFVNAFAKALDYSTVEQSNELVLISNLSLSKDFSRHYAASELACRIAKEKLTTIQTMLAKCAFIETLIPSIAIDWVASHFERLGYTVTITHTNSQQFLLRIEILDEAISEAMKQCLERNFPSSV
jgi:hypothetical protein